LVNTLSQWLDRWPRVKAALARVWAWFGGWSEEEVEEDYEVPGPTPPAIAPGHFEMRFMKLQAEGRFDEMWDMVADDAQRAWGGRETFIQNMPRMVDNVEILDTEVMTVRMLDEWHDRVHGRTYRNVAQMVIRYRVRHFWKEWAFDREVHLIPAADGWRTLCYPIRAKAAETVASR